MHCHYVYAVIMTTPVQIMNKTDLPVEPYVIISNELNPY